jgi:hypothetical protein
VLSNFIFVVSILLVQMQQPMEAVANMNILEYTLKEEISEF